MDLLQVISGALGVATLEPARSSDAVVAPGAGSVARIGYLEALWRVLPLVRPHIALIALSALGFLRVRSIR
ncbi:hypothetical protein KC217_23535, partial [Mycobacterium tuberculosis]|nr:hypothetical protein [Mycobacterium tuberculosis]